MDHFVLGIVKRISISLLILLFSINALTSSTAYAHISKPSIIGTYYDSPSIVIKVANKGHPRPKEKKSARKKAAAHLARVIKQVKESAWSRKNFEKLRQELHNSKTRDRTDFKYIKDGLIAHEGRANKPGAGHTIERHVGLSNAGLRKRYERDPSLVRRDGRRTTQHVSTFHSLRKAEYFIEKTIQNHMKTPEGRREMRDFVEGRGQNKITMRHQFTENTGRSLHGSSNTISNVNGVRVVLKRDPNHRNGWKVLTAMPEKGSG